MPKTLPQALLAAFCAILAILCAASHCACPFGGHPLEGGGVMFAMKQAMLGRGGANGWVNPYVTDGLIAMWDGEWNAGGGVHDQNSQVWVDIAGNGHNIDFTKNISSGSINFMNDRVFVDGAVTISDNPIVMSDRPNSPPSAIVQYHTFEVCFRYVKLNSSNVEQRFGCQIAGINSIVGYFMPWCIYERSDGYWDIGTQRRWIKNNIFGSGSPLSFSVVQNSDTYSFFLNSNLTKSSAGGYSYAFPTPILFTYFHSDEGCNGQIEIMNGRLYSRVL